MILSLEDLHSYSFLLHMEVFTSGVWGHLSSRSSSRNFY